MKSFHFCFFLLFNCFCLFGQDTFSIVAVDETTGEIGSAGASCVVGAAELGGVILISDIIPNRGAINAQATVCIPNINLSKGIEQMELGRSPQEILDWLYQNDACGFGNNENRQYGIVDFDTEGKPRSAAFTALNAIDHAGHRVGDYYAIQGNILLGPAILDSMEARFLRTEGSLAKRLMAAMQGANVPGADSRCLNAGTSSTSAFLQVYKPDDQANNPSLRLNVAETETGVEPIDSLQVLFDSGVSTSTSDITLEQVIIYPNPTDDFLQIDYLGNQEVELKLYEINGRLLHTQIIEASSNTLSLKSFGVSGLVIYQLIDIKNGLHRAGKIFVH